MISSPELLGFLWRFRPALLAIATLASTTGQVPDTFRYRIPPPLVDLQSSANLGSSVAVDGGYAVIGASEDVGYGGQGAVKVFDSMTGTLRFLLLPDGFYPNARFGASVALSGARVVIGAPATDPGASSGGKAFVYDLSLASPTVPIATLNDPEPAGGNHFGSSVAISGAYVVVGAHEDDEGVGTAGRAYIYDLNSTTPTAPMAVLHNPSAAGANQFGVSVAISGTRLVVGAPYDANGGSDPGPSSGSAFLYELSGGAITFVTRLNKPNPAAYDRFGISVAISGTRLAVGSPGNPTPGSDGGSAHVFDLSSATPFSAIHSLYNPSRAVGDSFGYSVSIARLRVVVGALGEDTDAPNSGRSYVYDLGSPTPTAPVVTLKNPSPAAQDLFGTSVAISGARVVVGAPSDDTHAPDAGGAYAFDLSSAAPEVPQTLLDEPTFVGRLFGPAVALSGTRMWVNGENSYVFDLSSGSPSAPVATLFNPSLPWTGYYRRSVGAVSGTLVAVGDLLDSTQLPISGGVWIYDVQHATPATLTMPFLTLDNPAPAINAQFGTSVAISGTRVVVGSPSLDHPSAATDGGNVYVYDLASATPAVPVHTLKNPTPALGDVFGFSVAILGTRIVVGAYGDDTDGLDAGRVYVYDLLSAAPTVPIATLSKPNPAAHARFGYSVAASGSRVVVTAWRPEVPGSAYVYDFSTPTPTVPVVTIHHPGTGFPSYFAEYMAISGTRVLLSATGSSTGGAFLYDLATATPHLPVAILNTLPGSSPVVIDGNTAAIGPSIFGPHSSDIVVELQPSQATVADGGHQSFGSVFADRATILGFALKNTGSSDLTGLAATIGGADAADFSIASGPVSPLNGPNGRTFFGVRFAPRSPGAKSATLHIASNDPDESPYDINLSGLGLPLVNRMVDQGSSVLFSVEAGAAASVQWRKDDVDIPGAVGSTLNIASVQPWHIGAYSARVTAAAGSAVSDVASLGIPGVPSGVWRGLVSCYPFEGNAQDLCRPNTPAKLFNTTGLVADAQRGGVAHIRGKGYLMPPLTEEPAELRGPGGFMQIHRPPLVDGAPFTFSMLVKEEGFSYWHGESLLTMGEAGASLELLTHYYIGSFGDSDESYGGPTGPVEFRVSEYLMDGGSVTLDLPWRMYTVVGDGNLLRLYRDGQLMGTTTYSKDIVGDFFIGRHWWQNGAFDSTRLIASVDDVRIYNRALSGPEVQQLYAQSQTPPPAGSFESWALFHGLVGAAAAPGADPDRDGFTNWEEYCFGTSPTDENGTLVHASSAGNMLTLTWFERAGVQYRLEETPDLRTSWAASALGPALSADQSGVPAGYQRIEVTLTLPSPAAGGQARFFRVQATKAL